MSGDGWGSSFGCIEPKTEVEAPKTIVFHNGSEIKFVGEGTDKIRSFEMTDLVPLDGGPLQLKTPWHIGPNNKEALMEPLSPSWPDSNTIKNKFERTNKVPTHDPYTNPDAQLYYSCNCGAILDPGTKRFAELNNCASKAGWKIRFTDSGYVPYCVECGKGVE